MKSPICSLAGLLACAGLGSALLPAQGQGFQSIPAPGRVELAHHPELHRLHITQGGEVLRYDLETQEFLPPYTLGGLLRGVAVSPDGGTLAVADATGTPTQVHIFLLEIGSGAVNEVSFPRVGDETGTHALTYSNSGQLFITSAGLADGLGTLRRYDPATGNAVNLRSLRVNSELSPEVYGTYLAFAETGAPIGDVGSYTTPSLSQGAFISASTTAVQVAVGVDAGDVLLATESGLEIFSRFSGAWFDTIGTGVADRPLGVASAYQGDSPVLFLPWVATNTVRVLDAYTYALLEELDLGETLPAAPTGLFPSGRARLSPDQGYLFVFVDGGVRALRRNAVPQTRVFNLEAPNDRPLAITLPATDSDGDLLSFTTDDSFLSGTLSGDAPNLTYTLNSFADFIGIEYLFYQATDTLDTSLEGLISIIWKDSPLPLPTSGAGDEDTSFSVTLSAQDSDSSSFTFSVVDPPAHGSVVITGATATYTPTENYFGPDSFTYTVSDGTYSSATNALVNLTVNPVNDWPVALSQEFTLTEGDLFTMVFPGLDADGDALSLAGPVGLPDGTLVVSNSGTVIVLRMLPGYSGDTEYGFQLTDGQETSFLGIITLHVLPRDFVPEADSFSASLLEGAPLPLTLSASDAEGDPLTYHVVTPPQHGTLSGDEPYLVYTPNPNYFGPDSFTYVANDGVNDSNLATVSLDVLPVNDAPTFYQAQSGLTVLNRSGVHRVRWLTSITKGGGSNPYESGQNLSFVVTTNRPGMFINQPAIAPNGYLTFRPGSTRGTATVTVYAQDNGGTANGGVDRSPSRTFTITVE